MHGSGIYVVNDVELLGKPIFYFNEVVRIPRGIAGTVESGNVSIHFTPCFPPFGSINEKLTLNLTDMLENCSILTNFIHDANIRQGSYNVTYNRDFWSVVFEDYLLDKNLIGTIPGDALGAINNMFTLHHSVCDNPVLPSTVTDFLVTISGIGIYTGNIIINYL